MLRVDLARARPAVETAALGREVVQLPQELLPTVSVVPHLPLRPLVGPGGVAVDVMRELAELQEARPRQRRDHVRGRHLDVVSGQEQPHPLQNGENRLPVVVGTLQGVGGADAVAHLMSPGRQILHFRGHFRGQRWVVVGQAVEGDGASREGADRRQKPRFGRRSVLHVVDGTLERASGGLVEVEGQGTQGLVALTLEGPILSPVWGLCRPR